jgi:hypothetical protein
VAARLIKLSQPKEMSNVREQRIYCAEQIYVPENLPIIIKHFSKEVIRNNPENIYEFSMK